MKLEFIFTWGRPKEKAVYQLNLWLPKGGSGGAELSSALIRTRPILTVLDHRDPASHLEALVWLRKLVAKA